VLGSELGLTHLRVTGFIYAYSLQLQNGEILK